MLETTYTLKLGQLVKITLNLKKYMWHKLKLEKLDIIAKVIPKLSVTTVVETHFEVDTATIKINN